MNDPGFDETAEEVAKDVENNRDSGEDEEELEQEEYLESSLWWFASTASPLIAGTFGPMANAFSICALVEKWRVYIPQGSDEAHGSKIEDPKWLIAVNSVSLVFALLANLTLLLNMARRLSFAIAQPITIIGFYFASFLLIALVAVASTSVFRIQPAQEHALSQAFYYGIMAAGIYFIIASLMAFTAFGAYRGRYDKEFRLTASQRTLMLQTIGFMVYLLLGALVFARIEKWNFLDGVYWANFTLLTVGIGGEYVPKTHSGRSLLFPYAVGGLIMVGLVIGSIRALILEHGKQKMAARFMEVKREKAISSIDLHTRTIRLGRFEKIQFSHKDLSETQRREQEFHVMRRIQALSHRKRRYIALAFSAAAAFILWFLGALVFMYSEKPQGFSYFVALYFAYTSLLTIGYGDYTINSNAGKAFFVFWSLLAIPTLTVLISNMGDTVIKEFKDFTIWVGSLTVLPDESGMSTALKIGVMRLKSGRISEVKPHRKRPLGGSEDRTLDRLAEHIEKEELERAEEAGDHGDYLERDIHFYHFVLAKEVRQLMKDVEVSPPKEYNYHDWQYYLRLIGQNEDDASMHRKPQNQHHGNGKKSTDMGTADDGNDATWSWLGIRSPLMGHKSEPQWLLQRLAATLESEMRMGTVERRKKQKGSPPISMRELKKRTKGRNSEQKDVNSNEAKPQGEEKV